MFVNIIPTQHSMCRAESGKKYRYMDVCHYFFHLLLYYLKFWWPFRRYRLRYLTLTLQTVPYPPPQYTLLSASAEKCRSIYRYLGNNCMHIHNYTHLLTSFKRTGSASASFPLKRRYPCDDLDGLCIH